MGLERNDGGQCFIVCHVQTISSSKMVMPKGHFLEVVSRHAIEHALTVVVDGTAMLLINLLLIVNTFAVQCTESQASTCGAQQYDTVGGPRSACSARLEKSPLTGFALPILRPRVIARREIMMHLTKVIRRVASA